MGPEYAVLGACWTIGKLWSYQWWEGGGGYTVRVHTTILIIRIVHGRIRRTTRSTTILRRRKIEASSRFSVSIERRSQSPGTHGEEPAVWKDCAESPYSVIMMIAEVRAEML